MFANRLYKPSNDNDNNVQCTKNFKDFIETKGFSLFSINYSLLKIFYIIFLILLFISSFIFQMKHFLEQYIYNKNYDFNRGKIIFRKCQLIYYGLRFLTVITFFILFTLFSLSDVRKFREFMTCEQIETIKIEVSLKTVVDLCFIMFAGLIFIGISIILDIIEFYWGKKLIKNHEKYLLLVNNMSIEVTVQH